MTEIQEFRTKIRQANGKYSIFDIIRECGRKNPRQVWNDLCERYPEVVTKTDNFKFPGRGQRTTPVATKENCLYILGLLPGLIGKKYREDAAKLMRLYLEDAEKLVEVATDKLAKEGNSEALHRQALRTKSKAIRSQLTKAITPRVDNKKDQGKVIGSTTNRIYEGLYGTDAKGLRAKHNIAPSENIRDNLSDDGLTFVMMAEQFTKSKMEKEDARNWEIPKIGKKAGKSIKDMYNDFMNS